MEIIYRSYTLCVFGQILNLQNRFTTLGGLSQADKNLPPGPFTGQFLRKADIEGLVSLNFFGPWFMCTVYQPSKCHLNLDTVDNLF